MSYSISTILKIVLFLTLLHVGAVLSAQKKTERFRGANTISVVTAIPQDSLFMVFGKKLLDENFMIIEKDNDFKTFRAKGAVGKYAIDVVYNIRVKDSTIILNGKSMNAGYSFEILYMKGRNIQSIAFDQMEALARSMGSEIYYEKLNY